ncbi:hypothetical protein [Enteractinococcus helveticum]|uniref:SnoaL-like domain-containing protein n=1 Tax=Enteractinococcus helveticum TaxID=1837282 RepID=A0A1B7LXI5_9MICC|nr:hypothetical protein [Enteractinococcus helveticum]OAV59885.1 hypothetical protein A6F49_14105 [Enteractinococcus helveticum]
MTQSAGTLDVIDIPEHCGNAPRKAVIRDFLIALCQRDIPQVQESLKDDVDWDILGPAQLQGGDDSTSWVESQPSATALHLHTVITHGTDCGADGRVTYTDGTEIAFNHVFIFAGHSKTAKIKTIRSYLVEINNRR